MNDSNLKFKLEKKLRQIHMFQCKHRELYHGFKVVGHIFLAFLARLYESTESYCCQHDNNSSLYFQTGMLGCHTLSFTTKFYLCDGLSCLWTGLAF